MTLGPDFHRLWAAHGTSRFGSLLTRAAIPFMAALSLRATPLEMAWLAAADLVASALVSMSAGAWLDRRTRRPVLVACDLARAVILTAVPLAWATGTLSIPLLVAVQLLHGGLSAVFEVAHAAYLPGLVGDSALVHANSRLSATSSAAEVSAFGIAGWLTQWIGGPLTVAIDALTYVGSAFFLRRIDSIESDPVIAPGRAEARWAREVSEGLSATLGHPVQRALAIGDVALHLGFGTFMACYTVFVVRTLGIAPGWAGMIFAVGGVSSLAAAALAPRLGAALGPGRVMAGGLVLGGLGLFAATLAPVGEQRAALALLTIQQIVGDGGWTLFLVHAASLRMMHAPAGLRGRIAATAQTLATLATLAGALLGGWAAASIGVRATLASGATAIALGAIALAVPRAWLQVTPEVHASLEVPGA